MFIAVSVLDEEHLLYLARRLREARVIVRLLPLSRLRLSTS